jgi:hypothetical protein
MLYPRAWVRSDTYERDRKRYVDPEVMVRQQDGLGRLDRRGDEQALRQRMEARRRLFVPKRAGAPRKDALKAEWRRLFYELRRTLAGWSDFAVWVSVADAHFRADPEAWPKYAPDEDGGLQAEDERKAAQGVWAAIA